MFYFFGNKFKDTLSFPVLRTLNRWRVLTLAKETVGLNFCSIEELNKKNLAAR